MVGATCRMLDIHMQNQTFNGESATKKVNKQMEEQWQQMEWGTNHFNNNCKLQLIFRIFCCCCFNDLQHTFGQVAIILFSNLSTICGSLENGRIVIHILDMDNDCGIVLLQIIGCSQTQLVLNNKFRIIKYRTLNY